MNRFNRFVLSLIIIQYVSIGILKFVPMRYKEIDISDGFCSIKVYRDIGMSYIPIMGIFFVFFEEYKVVYRYNNSAHTKIVDSLSDADVENVVIQESEGEIKFLEKSYGGFFEIVKIYKNY